MKLAILVPTVIFGAALPAAAAVAGEIPPAAIDNGARAAPFIQAAFGDGPPTGAHHGGRKKHGAETPKDTGPSQIDMHGATKEGADQAYRKKYGF